MKRFQHKHRLALALAPVISAFLLAGLTMMANYGFGRAASTIQVNSFEDRLGNDGQCTLREAIIAANKDKKSGGKPNECAAGSGADLILLPPGVYLLDRSDSGKEDSSSTGDLDINGDLSLVASAPGVTIKAVSGFSDRIFHVLGGSVTISGTAITGGNVTGDGGGILNQGSLTLENVTLQANNASQDGGAIHNAIGGVAELRASTISGNAAGRSGGAISQNGGVVSGVNLTVSGNQAKVNGGGYAILGGTLSINNATLTANTADSDRNGTGNGGGLWTNGGTISFSNSILAENSDASLAAEAPDCAVSGSGLFALASFNLVGDPAGCSDQSGTAIFSDQVNGNRVGSGAVPLGLEHLQDNNGPTPTHAIQASSRARDAGDDDTCEPFDQRGVPRPQSAACDMGAFELEDIAVNTTDDSDDGFCSVSHCSLREAIRAANARPGLDPILFKISASGTPTIMLISALPAITEAVFLDGTSQSPAGAVIVDGSTAGLNVDGLMILSGSSTVQGMHFVNFSGSGILLDQVGANTIQNNVLAGNQLDGLRIVIGDGNQILGNEIYNNGGDGISILAGVENQILGNDIHSNGDLPVDLGGDGRTPNDRDDPDLGANFIQNFPVLTSAVPVTGTLDISGLLNSIAGTDYSLEFFSSPTCNLSGSGVQTSIGSRTVTTGDDGNVYFQVAGLQYNPGDRFISATATDPLGNTSEFSDCSVIGANNLSWPQALDLPVSANSSQPVAIDQYLDSQGQSRWYRFKVEPNSQVVVTLTNLPANYDLTLYKDIAEAYEDLITPDDLVRLSAEFAPAAFSPAAFSPAAFSPAAFSPAAFSPAAFSPAAFSPAAFSPAAFSPAAFSPAAFSPDAFSPAAFSPAAFSPAAFSPAAFSPAAFSPAAFSPAAFSSAQTRSLIGVSAFDSTAGEGLIANTWNNDGFFYVRVRGRQGAFSLAAPFHLEVLLRGGDCAAVSPLSTPASHTAQSGGFRTLILTDLARMPGGDTDKMTLWNALATFAARSEIAGQVVNLGDYAPGGLAGDARVIDANLQADAYPSCPYAKNLVAGAIKGIVDDYRSLNPGLEYVVLVGSDQVIPFFRYPDHALLGPESDYVPPVFDATASQASLRLGYVLSQDAYGAPFDISVNANDFPVFDLAVGRLVETPSEALNMLAAYDQTSNGVVTPSSALVTGYDFLEDAALAVTQEITRGLGASIDTLITPASVSPQDTDDPNDPNDPFAWTASNLASLLLNNRYDLAFLSGHFSASSALAADYTTTLDTSDLLASSVDMTNAIIFSAGCHVGYNIVDSDAIPGITRQPDWGQAFARRGVTLIGGTGYQYGDTEFLEYSERLYLEFSRQLRTGSGPVPVGQALVAAKQNYLASTPQLRGIHEKALLEATLFGLPMLSVDMPGERFIPQPDTPVIQATTRFTDTAPTTPGAVLGLEFADLTVSPALNPRTLQVTNVEDGTTLDATYLAATDPFTGVDRIVTNPAEPVLPLATYNVSVPGIVLRGVGFRGGSYSETPDILPLNGAPTTEIRGVHTPFLSNVYFPIRTWNANYFDALADPTSGSTRLAVTPAQHISSQPGSLTSTLRQFSSMDFRLYYSNNVQPYANGSVPALAAPPSIVNVEATPAGGNVDFRIRVVGNPAAGIQEVWVTYTTACPAGTACSGTWQPLNLNQTDPNDSTLWLGSLPLAGTPADDIRFVVSAVNGVGVVSMATNLGVFYTPGALVDPQLTTLTLQPPSPASAPYGTRVTFEADLTGSGQPLDGQVVVFGLGAQNRVAITDSSGRASVQFPLLGLPGQYSLEAFFPGTANYAASAASNPAAFTITRQGTQITLAPQPASGFAEDPSLLVATLTDVGNPPLPLAEKTVFFEIQGTGSPYVVPVITDYLGRANLGKIPRPPGTYAVNAYFSGVIPLASPLVLTDAAYLSASASGSLTLLNHPPVAMDDAYALDEDGVLSVPAGAGVLANDQDVDPGAGLTAVVATPPAQGSLSLNPDGSFIYTPQPDFNGTVTFVYQASDGELADLATVTLTVNPVNDAPRPMDDSYSLNEDTVLSVPASTGVLANDLEVDGESLVAELVSDVSHGTLSFSPDGAFSYQPAEDYFGADSFIYQACDATGLCASALVNLTITPVNDLPDCSTATSSQPVIWPLDKDFVPIQILNVTDPEDGLSVLITITSIFQDEEVGLGPHSPDGKISTTVTDDDTAELRAERDGNGDGRVYHVGFTAKDSSGGTCSGVVKVPTIPHDQSGNTQTIDGGPCYDSTRRNAPRVCPPPP